MKLVYKGIGPLAIITRKRNRYVFSKENNIIDIKDYNDIYEIIKKYGGIRIFFEGDKQTTKEHRPIGITTLSEIGGNKNLKISINTNKGVVKKDSKDVINTIDKTVKSSKKRQTKKNK